VTGKTEAEYKKEYKARQAAMRRAARKSRQAWKAAECREKENNDRQLELPLSNEPQ
jgi:hypothetical protein